MPGCPLASLNLLIAVENYQLGSYALTSFSVSCHCSPSDVTVASPCPSLWLPSRTVNLWVWQTRGSPSSYSGLHQLPSPAANLHPVCPFLIILEFPHFCCGSCFLLVLIYFLIWVKCVLSSDPVIVSPFGTRSL